MLERLWGPADLNSANPLKAGWCSPGLQSGVAGFQTRENIRNINLWALALVTASAAVRVSQQHVEADLKSLWRLGPWFCRNLRALTQHFTVKFPSKIDAMNLTPDALPYCAGPM